MTMKKLCILILVVWTSSTLVAQQAFIKELAGTVEVKLPGSNNWIAARQGMTITDNTFISTGFKSTALISLGNTTLLVHALTRMTLMEIKNSQGTEQIDINLRAGRVRAVVSPPVGGRASVTVRGPTATASVRGTIFEFDTKTLTVEEGAVRYTGDWGRSVTVYPGASSTVMGKRNIASDPMETRAAELLPGLPAGADAVSGDGESNNPTVNFSITFNYLP
jgi:hypothetical protein